MNVAIITARAGSKSIINKNVFPVAGRPLISYPIQAAIDAELIDQIFVSTDGEGIGHVAENMGCRLLWRPERLCGDEVNHGEVIKHAVEEVDSLVEGLKNVTLLIGNTVMVDGKLIDQSLGMLEDDPTLDSVMSLWEAADDHPLRALEIDNGIIRPYGGEEREVSTNRQAYPKAYYYDQGVWTFKKESVQKRKGPNPWWWMGEKCAPIIREWVTGRDVHGHLDIAISEWWLQHHHSTLLAESKA